MTPRRMAAALARGAPAPRAGARAISFLAADPARQPVIVSAVRTPIGSFGGSKTCHHMFGSSFGCAGHEARRQCPGRARGKVLHGPSVVAHFSRDGSWSTFPVYLPSLGSSVEELPSAELMRCRRDASSWKGAGLRSYEPCSFCPCLSPFTLETGRRGGGWGDAGRGGYGGEEEGGGGRCDAGEHG